MKLILAAFLMVVLVPAEASAQQDADCAVICDSLAGCSGGRSASGGTGVSEPMPSDAGDGEPGEPGDNGEPPAGGEDDDGGDNDDGNEDEPDAEGDGDREEEMEDGDGEMNAAVRAACMASCGQMKAVEAALVAATAGCVAELDDCWDFDEECAGVAQLPGCVTACEKLIECEIVDPCGDTAVSSEDSGGGSAGVPVDAEETDPATPPERDGSGDGDDGDSGSGGGEPEERQFHLECDEDGGFNTDEAVVECAAECAQSAFVAFAETHAIVDCIAAEQCGEVEEICADEVAQFEEADGVAEMGRGGGLSGGGAEADADNTAGGGADGQDDAAPQAGGPGNEEAGAGGNAGGGGGRSSDGGLCASAPGAGANGLRQLIGIVLRR